MTTSTTTAAALAAVITAARRLLQILTAPAPDYIAADDSGRLYDGNGAELQR